MKPGRLNIASLLNRWLSRWGYKVVPCQKAPTRLARMFHSLRMTGFSPKLLFEVGANRGSWTADFLRFFPECRCVLIEPQPHLRPYLEAFGRQHDVTVLTAAAGSEPGNRRLVLNTDDDTTASLAFPGSEKDPQVEVLTLDQIAEMEYSHPQVIKIDAEGYDLQVLRGAQSLLGKTDLIFIEATVCCPWHENTMESTLRAMRRSDYQLIGITDLNQSGSDWLWTTELVFARKSSLILDRTSRWV